MATGSGCMESMGVISSRWMWVESMVGVVVRRYTSCICSFLQQHPYFLFIFLINMYDDDIDIPTRK